MLLRSQIDLLCTIIGNVEAQDSYFLQVWDSLTVRIHELTEGPNPGFSGFEAIAIILLNEDPSGGRTKFKVSLLVSVFLSRLFPTE